MARRTVVSALLYTIRPSACLGIALFATAGLGRWDDLFVITLTFSAAFIGGAGCFLINDIFDREKDLKNNKLRPIATGEIPVRTAFILSVICCLAMLVSSVFLSFNTLILAVLLIAMFWSYSYINQRFGLLSNIWVSVCSVLAFLFGALVYELTPLIYFAMFFTLFVNIGREILLDAIDQAGDQAVGKPSIRLLYGEKRTKVIVALFFALGSLSLLVYLLYFPAVWPWMSALLLLLWVPFFVKNKNGFRKWALHNVRTSHLFFAVLIAFLFTRPANWLIAPPVITANYCLERLEKLQTKEDGFYPIGVFPTQRTWLAKKGEEDNNIFNTVTIAYMLRSTNERKPSERARGLVERSIQSIENYRSRRGEPQYNFWPSVGEDIPFPNSIFLSYRRYRSPDDYDDTALVQLARGSNPMDQSVRAKMVKYALRPDRKVVKHFPSEHRLTKVYEVWYADKMQQELDIVAMANVLLFVMEKGYSLETPDRHTINCLKTSIKEEWYFKNPAAYAQYYNRPAIILYCLARLVEKDQTGEFTAQRQLLIRHLRRAMDQTDQAIEKVMIASSLLRLGETGHFALSRDQVTKDAESFAFFCYKPNLLPTLNWRSEAVSWALVYELLSFDPNITWK